MTVRGCAVTLAYGVTSDLKYRNQSISPSLKEKFTFSERDYFLSIKRIKNSSYMS